ncbi:hypothetical protein BESB_007500 [Besnoitia besnoiti]|uniref:Uncharacterized protein n=1 Tax=Besnoitia besnoiti TaxID=94643 RepID=A0A2A9MIP8_BESBE|nr:hypothetical protein BESB_007500 [Besnoitia besnoiti]PFH38408.1 hypothetical protein BESB_007500 [Besnoitia besnoiti]
MRAVEGQGYLPPGAAAEATHNGYFRNNVGDYPAPGTFSCWPNEFVHGADMANTSFVAGGETPASVSTLEGFYETGSIAASYECSRFPSRGGTDPSSTSDVMYSDDIADEQLMTGFGQGQNWMQLTDDSAGVHSSATRTRPISPPSLTTSSAAHGIAGSEGHHDNAAVPTMGTAVPHGIIPLDPHCHPPFMDGLTRDFSDHYED